MALTNSPLTRAALVAAEADRREIRGRWLLSSPALFIILFAEVNVRAFAIARQSEAAGH